MKTQIHTTVANDDLPECLKRKAVFGDREQIEALRDLETSTDRAKKREQDIKDGILKKFSVNLEWSQSYNVDVWAKDAGEAEEVAKDEADYPDDFDLSVWAREVKQN